MRSVSSALCLATAFIIAGLLATILASAAEEGPYLVELRDPEDHDVVLETLYLLTTNRTENITARLLVDELPPYHAGEGFMLSMAWMVPDDANVTAEVGLGLDLLVPSTDWDRVAMIATPGDVDGDPLDLYAEFWRTSAFVMPSIDSELLMGRVFWGNESVNLSIPISPLPARTIMAVGLDTPDGSISVPEGGWSDIPLRLFNDGGAPALELVVDIRYSGRIAHTAYMPLVAPGGNASLHAPLLPVLGEEVLGVYLVSGPGAPRWLTNLTIQVTPVTLLRVVSVMCTEEEVVSGSRVAIEVEVANLGNFTSTEQMVELMVDGAVVENATVVGLAPGDVTVLTFRRVLRGPGIHTISARVEGDELDAVTSKVEVVEDTSSVGAVAVILVLVAIASISRVGWRLARAGRA